MKVCIVGKGEFGTAIGSLLNKNNIDICFSTTDKPIVNFEPFDVLLIAIPSKAIKLLEIQNFSGHIVILTKGMLTEGSEFFLSDFFTKQNPNAKISILSGPNFASEIKQNISTITTISSKNIKNAEYIANLFQNTCLTCEIDDNIYQAQIFGVAKNIMAIYCGYMQKMEYGMNEIIKNLLELIKETQCLTLKIQNKTNLIAANAIGDIILSCFSSKSRNKTFGENIATKNYPQNTLVEGLQNVKCIQRFANQMNFKLTKFQKIFDLIDEYERNRRI